MPCVLPLSHLYSGRRCTLALGDTMARIFISYRRADTITMVGRIYERLAARFGRRNIFIDVDDMPAGTDFRGKIGEAVSACKVALVFIGPQWLTVTDDQGNRRLDDPEDWVRIEVEAVLSRDSAIVIPVLVQGATPGAKTCRTVCANWRLNRPWSSAKTPILTGIWSG